MHYKAKPKPGQKPKPSGGEVGQARTFEQPSPTYVIVVPK